MTRRFVLALATAPCLCAQQKKKPPELELIEAAARVEEGRINLDSRVKNIGVRPIQKLKVIFELLDSDNKVLTKQQGAIENELLGPGEESGMQAQMASHARAVAFRLEFEDGSGREVRAEKTGPFPIEQ